MKLFSLFNCLLIVKYCVIVFKIVHIAHNKHYVNGT